MLKNSYVMAAWGGKVCKMQSFRQLWAPKACSLGAAINIWHNCDSDWTFRRWFPLAQHVPGFDPTSITLHVPPAVFQRYCNSWAFCPPDYIHVLQPWVYKLQSLTVSFMSVSMTVNLHRVFYFENWLDSHCFFLRLISFPLNLLCADLRGIHQK